MLSSVGVTDLWTYVIGTILIVLLPGPNSLFVLATAAARGIATATARHWGFLSVMPS